MKKLSIAGALVVAIGWTALSWNDNSAQDAADYAATHPVVTLNTNQAACRAAGGQ